MSSKPSKQPLERTSVQLPRQTIELLDSWPTLNRSEALRLVVDRYIYLETAAAPLAERLAERYRPVFKAALDDLSFADFKVVARSLPAIVMGAMAEEGVRDAIENERSRNHEPDINWKELEGAIAALDPLARIWILESVVRERLEPWEAKVAETAK
jgi:hypothetical protein